MTERSLLSPGVHGHLGGFIQCLALLNIESIDSSQPHHGPYHFVVQSLKIGVSLLVMVGYNGKSLWMLRLVNEFCGVMMGEH